MRVHPEELFDDAGAPSTDLTELAPKGPRRMSANPHANGGALLRDLQLPDFRKYAIEVQSPGAASAEATRVQGAFVRDVIKQNPENFRVFSPAGLNAMVSGALDEVLHDERSLLSRLREIRKAARQAG